jgi:protein gp37
VSAVSTIEWTDASWNPVRGCTKVSPGCKHCYAETFAERFRGVPGHPYEQGFDPRLAPEVLEQPLRWRKPRRIFVCSMADLFHDKVPDDYIAAVFGVMAACPQHTFQVLTKRAERLAKWFAWVDERERQRRVLYPDHEPAWRVGQMLALALLSASSLSGFRPSRKTTGHESFDPRLQPWPLPNVWIGVSAERQMEAQARIPLLLQAPAVVHFVSAEPLLGPLDLDRIQSPGGFWNCLRRSIMLTSPNDPRRVGWVIAGGESGPGARGMDPAWALSLRDQCVAARVPFFFKQWGGVLKRRTGRELEGRTWDEMPGPAAA